MAAVSEALEGVSGILTSAGSDVETKCENLEDPAAMLAASVPYMDGIIDKVKETARGLTQVTVNWPH
jgi:hypothetical protein